MAAPSREGIVGLVAPVAERAGLDLEDVVVTPAGKRRMVRVVVDGDDGVDLDVIAAISREVAELLDESDVMGELAYTLEVTSPGIDRPLQLPRHWRRAIGRLVQVTPHQGGEFTGRVRSTHEDGATHEDSAQDEGSGSVTLDVKGRDRTIAYADVARAKVQIEFKRASSQDAPDPSLSIDEE